LNIETVVLSRTVSEIRRLTGRKSRTHSIARKH